MNPRTEFPALIHTFFSDWLGRERDLSPHTIRSYRDTWRLFLRFLEQHRSRSIHRLALSDLSAADVLAFLEHHERTHHITGGTRNCRLAALRALFDFAAQRDPSAIAQAAEIRRIPRRRGVQRPVCYLEQPEVEALLAQPDRSTAEGQRDHTLIAFLYNTGARIQEALDVCPHAVRFDTPSSVKLFGKGRKERICPLWPETSDLLAALLRRQPRASDQPIFVNRYGQRLGASGVRVKLAQYVAAAAKTVPSIARKRISPHTFRHSTAVHLIASGVDITVIRAWLGHADLETTAHYAQANLQTKRDALARLSPPAATRGARWKRDASVLAWLDSL
jgi:site-specific recombinase XerD